MKSSYLVARTLWAGLFPLYIMEELNLVPDGFEILDVEEYDETLVLLEQGKIDANFNSLADALLLFSKGIDLKLIMPSDLTIGVDGLVSHKNYPDLFQLRGKKIGVSMFTYSHVLVNQVLEKYGFSDKEFNFVNVRGEKVLELINTGEIAAGHTWGIHLRRAVNEGANVIFTSKEFPGLLVDSLVVRKDSLDKDRSLWKEFIKAHQKTLSYWQEHYDDGIKLISKSTGFSVDEIHQMLEGVQFFNQDDEAMLFDPQGTNPPNLFASGKIFLDFFNNKGVLKSTINLNSIINPI